MNWPQRLFQWFKEATGRAENSVAGSGGTGYPRSRMTHGVACHPVSSFTPSAEDEKMTVTVTGQGTWTATSSPGRAPANVNAYVERDRPTDYMGLPPTSICSGWYCVLP